MEKVNYAPVYRESGQEDLDGTYRRAVFNVRILVEDNEWDYLDAVEEVTTEMNLTFQEYKRIQSEASEHYV